MTQIITHCGSFSHVSQVPGGYQTYMKDISRESCLKVHNTGYLDLGSKIVDGIKSNTTTPISQVHVGGLDMDGSCTGSTYTFHGTTWNNVVVQHYYTITLQDYEATVRLADNKIILQSGVSCDYLTSVCDDIDSGRTFWTPVTDKKCEDLGYDVLYTGPAEKAVIYNKNLGVHQSIYSVNQDDMVFAMTILRPIPVCMAKGYQTEHSKLIILPKDNMEYRFKIRSVTPRNIDLFAYVNSKFVYTERHIRNQVMNLYNDIIRHKCELEREVLQTQLSIAEYSPNEFAFLRMKSPGYMAQIMGETITIIKCQPVEVIVRPTITCFNELPISYNNKTAYMTPKNHLIHYVGTEIDCSAFMMPMYRLKGSWFGLSPSIHSVNTPLILQPSTTMTWQYDAPGNLASAGIYSISELENFRKQVLFPTERRAITNVLTRAIYDSQTDRQNLAFERLINDNTIDGIMSKYWEKAWGWFSWVGNFMAGIMGIYCVGRLIKFLIDTAIHAWALYPLYGLSWKLIGMFWDTITYCLVHLKTESNRNSAENDVEREENPQTVVPLIHQEEVKPTCSAPPQSIVEHVYVKRPLCP